VLMLVTTPALANAIVRARTRGVGSAPFLGRRSTRQLRRRPAGQCDRGDCRGRSVLVAGSRDGTPALGSSPCLCKPLSPFLIETSLAADRHCAVADRWPRSDGVARPGTSVTAIATIFLSVAIASEGAAYSLLALIFSRNGHGPESRQRLSVRRSQP
jgi:hypothetical protein